MQLKTDLPNRKITIIRTFEAPAELVWKAWTEPEYLDQWWAPKPWRAETKSMSFKEGGIWLYAMVGPENERNWVKVEFVSINPITRFTSKDFFCDEEGNPEPGMPEMKWDLRFSEAGDRTEVLIEIIFNSEADLQKILEMGFQQGFEAAQENLDLLLLDKSIK